MTPFQIILLIVMVAAIVVSLVFQPKPLPPVAATLSDFDVPTAQEGRAIPELIGTDVLKGPNVVWYGHPYVQPIEKETK